ncbi:MAG: hypothetical protein M0Q14_08570 [Tissierellaceae bacterium]|nr:hypothetical protein [Tissierellaceae bacterium]
MARFNADEIDNYGGQGGGGFFSLKNDKDVATVRFMYNSIDDIQGYAVHEIEVDGKKRYVNCLREYNQPLDDCPLCAAKSRVIAKLFVILYDVESEEIKIWDRGKTFFSKLSSLCARYNPLVSTPFEIERNGKKGDTKTTYETYALDTDDTTLEDLPEVPELLGTLILDKSFEELEFFLDNGYFEESVEEQAPPERNPKSDRRNSTSREPANEAPARRRRTPASAPTEDKAPTSRPTGRRRTIANQDKF